MNGAFLLISGGNYRAVIAACRRFSMRGVPFYVVARSKNDYLYRTRYKKRIVVDIGNTDLNTVALKNIITDLKQKYSIDRLVILPTAEHLNRFLLDNRTELEDTEGVIVPIVDDKTYCLISDKRSFGDLCLTHEILLPPEIDPTKLPFPFVAKQLHEVSAIDGRALIPYLIYNDDDWNTFTAEQRIEDYYFQEFIFGKSIYLLFYFSRDGKYRFAAQQNGAQQPGGKSVVLAWTCAFDDTTLKEHFVRLFRDVGFYGVVMVELKTVADKSYMIEANPRLWGPTQLLIDSGANLIDGYIDEFITDIGTDVPVSYKLGTTYFWFSGFVSGLMSSKGINWFDDGKAFFWRHMPGIIRSDIYMREDTISLFANELKVTIIVGIKRYIATIRSALTGHYKRRIKIDR